MAANSSVLHEKHLAFIRLLVEGKSPTEICELLDVGRTTYYEWRESAAWQAAVREYQAYALKQVHLRLTQMANPALETLEMGTRTGMEPTRIAAARDILDRIGANFVPEPDVQPPVAPVMDTGDPWERTEK